MSNVEGSKKVSTEFIKETLLTAVNNNASDIHITENKIPAMRINGKLTEITTLKPWGKIEFAAFLKTINLLDKFRESNSVNSSFTLGGKRFRFHGYKSFSGNTFALRIIPVDIPKFDDLNLPEQILRLAKQRSGLILVTGPTGSGKSTTLASILEHINQDEEESNMILTIEQPVEFIYKEKNARIVQREVGKNVNTFEEAVVDAMREDPDIILIGELQDRQTIHNAITLAETGHLVLGSLHSNGAADTFDRIIDAFPGDQQGQVRSQLANRVLGIIHQTLIPKKDGKGRVPMVELLLLDDSEIRRAVRNDSKISTLENLMKEKHGKGLMNKERSVAELLKKDLITMETAIRYSNSTQSDINRIKNTIR